MEGLGSRGGVRRSEEGMGSRGGDGRRVEKIGGDGRRGEKIGGEDGGNG